MTWLASTFQPPKVAAAICGRLVVAGGALLLFGFLEWQVVRELYSSVISVILMRAGYDIEQWGAIIQIGSFYYAIDPECTYIDLIFVAAPFCVWLKKPCQSVHWLVISIVFISLLNIVRIVSAIAAHVSGATWIMVHDVPDVLIWYPVFVLAVLNWSRIAREIEKDPAMKRAWIGGENGE